MAAVTLLTTTDALDRLRLRWHALWLETRDAHLFQTYGWFRAALGRGVEGGVLVVRDGRDVCGLVPLQMQRRRTPLGVARILRFPIPSWVPTFGPVGPEPTRTWLAVLDYLRRSPHMWDACDWRGIDVAHVDRHRLVTASRFRRFRFTALPEPHWGFHSLDRAVASCDPARFAMLSGSHEAPSRKTRIETSVPPRPAIVNPVEASSAAEETEDAFMPGAQTDEVAWGCAAGDRLWTRLLRQVGAATGDVVHYRAWQDGVSVAQWWVVRGGEHWSVVGRRRCAGDWGRAAEADLRDAVLQDAQAAGKQRLWIVGDRAEGTRQAPVRFLASSGRCWSGRWYVRRTATRLKAARRSAEKEKRNWARVPVP